MTRTQPTRSAKPTAEAAAKPATKTKAAKTFATGQVVLIAGLGNPGAQYARNRHNVGFMALDAAAEQHGFAPWRSKFQGEMAEVRIGDKRIILLKPMTFMNESGQAVGEAARFLKVPPGDVIVVHDELDLAPGKCRVKFGGGHAGHNGLRSIHAHIGAEYARVRLGIGHPGDKNKVSGYVLHDFAKSEEAWLDDLLRGFSDGLPKLVAGDDAGFQNALALRVNPPRPSSGKAAPARRSPGKAPPHQAKMSGKRPAEAVKKAQNALKDAGPTNPLARLLAKFSKS
ncbi:MAG: aminoacyl-tRNA hydrolase [Pseudomonadota bacterium]